MSINLPVSSDLLKKKKLSYNSLANLTILSPSPIGFWQQIEEKIPGIKLIYQDQTTDYAQIINYSNFPYFTTNLAKLDPNWGITLPGNRMTKALSDKQAQQKFYASFLKQNSQRLLPVIHRIQDQWSQVD